MITLANTATRKPRRALVLVLMLVVTVLVGAALAVLTGWAGMSYRDHQGDQARVVAQAIADSGAAYARAHAQQWAAHPPEKDVTLDVSALLLPNMNGSAVISFPTVDGHKVCRVSATAEIGAVSVLDEIDVSLPVAASQPAS